MGLEIIRCWAQNPLERPGFDEIVRMLSDTFSNTDVSDATASVNSALRNTASRTGTEGKSNSDQPT